MPGKSPLSRGERDQFASLSVKAIITSSYVGLVKRIGRKIGHKGGVIMLLTNLRWVFCGLLGLSAAVASAADPWTGSRIMPKSNQLLLRVGSEYTGDVYQIEWPATVERIEGQWLWITDRGGYDVPPVAGWVSKEDVLPLNEAHDHYLRTLRTDDAPWVHWLLGIYLENKRDSQTAREEYEACLGIAPGDPDGAVVAAVERAPYLLDAAIRLAKLPGAPSGDATASKENLLLALSAVVDKAALRRPQLRFEAAEALATPTGWKSAECGTRSKASTASSPEPRQRRTAGPRRSKTCLTTPTISTGLPSLPAGPPMRALTGGKPVWAGPNSTSIEQPFSKIKSEPFFPTSPLPRPRRPRQSIPIATSRPSKHRSIYKCSTGWPAELRSAKPRPIAKERAQAAAVSLTAAIQSLQTAIACFGEAIRRNPDLVEAYRDRGMAYLLLSQSEGALGRARRFDPTLAPGSRSSRPELASPSTETPPRDR